MNAATMVVADWMSAPEKRPSRRCQTTWYWRAAKPETKKRRAPIASIEGRMSAFSEVPSGERAV